MGNDGVGLPWFLLHFQEVMGHRPEQFSKPRAMTYQDLPGGRNELGVCTSFLWLLRQITTKSVA